jgi:hypothetical protein
MVSASTIDDIIQQIQVLRSGLLPGYAGDGDEGERTIEDYVAVYGNNIDSAMPAVSEYLGAFQALLDEPESTANFPRFLAARRLFIQCFPFCEDELPLDTSPDYQAACVMLRNAFIQKAERSFGSRELANVKQYQVLLNALGRLLTD